MKEIVIPQSGSNEGRHIKILVEVDISQLLLRGTTVKFNNVPRWIEFKYERCPDFCYNCGIIGHGEKSCFNRKNVEATSQEQQYEIWMKAKGTKAAGRSYKASTNQDYFDNLRIKAKNNIVVNELQIQDGK